MTYTEIAFAQIGGLDMALLMLIYAISAAFSGLSGFGFSAIGGLLSGSCSATSTGATVIQPVFTSVLSPER